MVCGAAIGPLPFGMAFDRYDGYREILLASAVLTGLAAVLALLITPLSLINHALPPFD